MVKITLTEERVKHLSLKQKLLAKLKEENESGFTGWTLELGIEVKKEGSGNLKKRGLL